MADVEQAVALLLVATREARPEDLAPLAARAAELLDADELVIFLVDYEQRNLMPLVGPGTLDHEVVPVDGTLPGRAFALTEEYEAVDDTGHRTWIPLLNGAERLGIVEIGAKAAPSALSRAGYRTVANLLAELLMTRRAYGDAIERTRRRIPMQLPAEIVWKLLPPLTFVGQGAAVTGILEPSYDVGGDAFDYAANGTILHVAVFDAVGHGIDATALASLAINAYRNARRCGLDLVDTYRSVDKWVFAQHPGRFVTAVLAELDVTTGVWRRISAGHPAELLLRNGRLVKVLEAPTALPLGLGQLGDPIPEVEEEALEPGDQLLIYTDGVTEARTEDGEFFGVDRLVEFVTKALADELSLPETMRRLVHAILAHQYDRLQDDATAVLLEWRPGASPIESIIESVSESVSAEQAGASPPSPAGDAAPDRPSSHPG